MAMADRSSMPAVQSRKEAYKIIEIIAKHLIRI